MLKICLWSLMKVYFTSCHCGHSPLICVTKTVFQIVSQRSSLAKYAATSFERSSHFALERSSALLYPCSFNISRSSSGIFNCRLSCLSSPKAAIISGSYWSVPTSLPWLASLCQLDKVCIAMPSCFAVDEISKSFLSFLMTVVLLSYSWVYQYPLDSR